MYDSTSKTKTYQPARSVNTEQVSISEAIDHLMDPVARNNAQGRRPHGFICLHVDDLFMAGDKVFESKVLSSLRKNFAVGSEDKNDIMFVGQRVKWMTHDKYGPYVSVDQKLAVDAVEEVKIDKSLKDYSMQPDPFLDSSIGYRVELRFTFATSSRVVPQPLLVRLLEMSVKSRRLFAPLRARMLMVDFGH